METSKLTIEELIETFLAEATDVVPTKAVMGYVLKKGRREDGRPYSSASVTQKLGDMVANGTLIRPKHGHYALADPTGNGKTEAALSVAGLSQRARTITLPVYEMTAGAGSNGGIAYGEAVEYYSIDYVEIATIYDRDPDEPFVIEVLGDSMESDFTSGEKIIIEPYPKGTQNIPSPGVYLIRIEDYYEIKQVERLPGGKLLLTPRNEYYRSYELEISGDIEFEIVGRVYGKFKRY